jgi:hypothetical protein
MSSPATTTEQTGFWAILRALFGIDEMTNPRLAASWDGLPVQVVETPPRCVSA